MVGRCPDAWLPNMKSPPVQGRGLGGGGAAGAGLGSSRAPPPQTWASSSVIERKASVAKRMLVASSTARAMPRLCSWNFRRLGSFLHPRGRAIGGRDVVGLVDDLREVAGVGAPDRRNGAEDGTPMPEVPPTHRLRRRRRRSRTRLRSASWGAEAGQLERLELERHGMNTMRSPEADRGDHHAATSASGTSRRLTSSVRAANAATISGATLNISAVLDAP